MSVMADIPWLRVLVEYLIKTTLVISFGLALTRLLRRRTASLRHFVLFLFLAGLLLLPALSIFPAGWQTRLLPSRPEGRFRSPGPVFPMAAETPALATRAENVGTTGPEPGLYAVLGETARPAAQRDGAPRLRLGSGALPVVWLAVLLLLVSRLTLGLLRAVRLTRESEAVDEPVWKVLSARCLTAIRLRRRVRLKSHPEVVIPLTWGVRRPVVLIPAGHREWTDEQRAAALVHELCHVKRADFLALLLARLSLAVFWFNPLCWIALRRLKKEQEKACDELVLKTGVRPSTYAANLLFFKRAAGVRWPATLALVGIAAGSPFQDRLTSILRPKQVFTEVKMKTKLMLALPIILVVGLVGLARPSAATAEAVSEAAIGLPAVAADASLQAETAGAQTAAPSQEKKAETQEEKKKEEKEKKAEKGSTFVIETREGKKVPLEITIVQGNETKKLRVESSITIKKDAGESFVVMTADGKEIKISEGEPFRLEIEGGALSLIKEGKAIKLETGGNYRLIAKKGKADTVTYQVLKPGVDIVKVEKGVEKGAHGVLMIGQKAEPSIAWTVREDLAGIREKIRALREKLKKATEEKLDLKEVDEALAGLEADLKADIEKETEEPEVGLKIVREPRVFTVVEGSDKGKQEAWVAGVKEGSRKDAITVTVADKADGFSLVYTMLIGEKKREIYDRIVERVKKELPEGCTFDPSFEEETGAVTLKITAPPGKEAVKELVHKLGSLIKEEIEQAKK